MSTTHTSGALRLSFGPMSEMRLRVPIEADTWRPRSMEPRSNRRAAERYAVDFDVTLQSQSNFYTGSAENLSVGGVFVVTDLVRPIGDLVDLVIHLPNRPEAVHAVGQVRWARKPQQEEGKPPGLGVQFFGLNERGANTIRDFLSSRAPLVHDE